MPVYNVEKYLPETIQSVLCQNFEHYEAIFVNDASTDSCPSLLNKTQQEHPQKIKVIHLKENRGLLYARKIGVQHATGKFISFLDGDDTFLPHAFETMACEMHKNPADILRFLHQNNTQKLPKNMDSSFWQSRAFPTALGNNAILRTIFSENKTIWNIWALLIQTKLIKKVFAHLPDDFILNGEDALTMLILAYFAQSFAFSPHIVYEYRIGSENSFTAQTSPEKIKNVIISAKNIQKALDNFQQNFLFDDDFKRIAQWIPHSILTWRAQNVFDLWRNACNEVFEKDPHHPLYLYCQNLLFVAPLPQSKAEKLGRFLLFPFIQLRHWWRHFLKKFKN